METADTVAIDTVVALHRSGRLDEARAGYLNLLVDDPGNADIHNYLGMLEFQAGDTDRGVELVEKCIELDPHHAAACNNLANMYLTTYRPEDAERCYMKAIALDERAVEPLHNMAIIEKTRRNYSQAEHYFNRVLELDPDYLVSVTALAEMYASLGHFEPAFALLKSALQKARGLDVQKATLMSLARLCVKMGNPEAAADLYRQLLTLSPDDPVANHMLAAVTGQAVPDRSDQRYITQIFDGFATTFDSVLDRLDYRLPEQIQRVLDQLYPSNNTAGLTIVDAGCGTGLCGHGLRPLAARLVGVDLSGGMLARARFRGVYDELIEQDLVEYLQGLSGSVDLIVCADTLCYFGDLLPVLAAVRHALRPMGRLVFSVERQDEQSQRGFHLQGNGRYSHSQDYLEHGIQLCGFRLLALHERVIRKESGRPVQGYLPVLERPAD